MSLHLDLLRQAEHLARREPRHPRQESLRRAVSAAYYALFHLLVGEATNRLVGVLSVRTRFSRAFDHGDMKQASRAFGGSPTPQQLATLTNGSPIPAELRDFALAFIQLQDARHEADYDVGKTFTRQDVNGLIARARQSVQWWQAVRTQPVVHFYLAALLLWKRWHR
jgi:hypothetical protein